MRYFRPDVVPMLIHGSPRSASAAQILHAAQDAICRLCLLEPLAEIMQIIRPIAAYYDAQLTEELQARVQERATMQARLNAVQERSVQEQVRLTRQLAKKSEEREAAFRVVRLVCARMKLTEDEAKQLALDKKQRLRQNRGREDLERLKMTTADQPQEPRKASGVCRTTRPIIPDDSTPV